MPVPEGARVVSITSRGVLYKCADGTRCYADEFTAKLEEIQEEAEDTGSEDDADTEE